MDQSSPSIRHWHLAIVSAVVYCYVTFFFNLLLQKCGWNFCTCIQKTVLDFILSAVFNYYLFQLLKYYQLCERSVADVSVQADKAENSLKLENAFDFGQTSEDISSSGMCEYFVESSSNSENIIKEYDEHSETPKISFDLDFSNSLIKPKQNVKRRYSFPLRLSKKFNSSIDPPTKDLLYVHRRQKIEESELALESKSTQNEAIPLKLLEMQKHIKECLEKVCRLEFLISKNTNALKIAGNMTGHQKDSLENPVNYENACLNVNVVQIEDFTNSSNTSKLERDLKNAARPSRHSTPLSDAIHDLEIKKEIALKNGDNLLCENCKNEDIGQLIHVSSKSIVEDGSINNDVNVDAKTPDILKNNSCHDINKSSSSIHEIETAGDRTEFDTETCPVVQKQPKSLFRFPFKSVTLQNMGSPISYSGDYEVDPFTMLHKTMRNFGRTPIEKVKNIPEINVQSDIDSKDNFTISSGNESKISRGVTLNPSDLEKQLKGFPKNLENCLTSLNKKTSGSSQNHSKDMTGSATLQPTKIDKHKYRSTSLPHLHSETSSIPKSIVKDRWNDIVSTVTNLMKKYQPPKDTTYPFQQAEHSIFDFTQQNYEEIANGIIVDHPKRRNYLFHLDDEIPTGSAQDTSFGSFIVLDTPKADKSLKPKPSSNLSSSNIRTIAESISVDNVLESLDLENVSKVYSLVSGSLGTSMSQSEGSIEQSISFLARLQRSFNKWKSATKENSSQSH